MPLKENRSGSLFFGSECFMEPKFLLYLKIMAQRPNPITDLV